MAAIGTLSYIIRMSLHNTLQSPSLVLVKQKNYTYMNIIYALSDTEIIVPKRISSVFDGEITVGKGANTTLKCIDILRIIKTWDLVVNG